MPGQFCLLSPSCNPRHDLLVKVKVGLHTPVGGLAVLQDVGHQEDGVGCRVDHWGAQDAHLRAQIWAGGLHASGRD